MAEDEKRGLKDKRKNILLSDLVDKNIFSTFANRTGKNADVAQLAEQLICNQSVGGSSPFIGS